MIGCAAESMIGSGMDDFINVPRIREMIQEALATSVSEANELTEEILVNDSAQAKK